MIVSEKEPSKQENEHMRTSTQRKNRHMNDKKREEKKYICTRKTTKERS